MARSAYEVNVKCPFYLREVRTIICCEGLLKNTCMTTSFPSAKQKKQHLTENCYKENGGGCPMAKNLFAKYGYTAPEIKKDALPALSR